VLCVVSLNTDMSVPVVSSNPTHAGVLDTNLYDPGSVVIDTLNIQMHDSSISWLELGLGMVL
jgi:hypothetical protein